LKEIEEAIARDKQNQDVNGKYFNAMSEGDEAVKNKEYSKAKAAYEKALGIKAGDVPAKTKLDQVIALIAKDEKDKESLAKYTKLIQDGDKAMGKEDYPAAKIAYTEASQLRADQVYPKDQLRQITNLMAGKEKRDAKYKAAMANGDKLFGAKDYVKAKIAYQEASDTKPGDAVAKQKIKDCDAAIDKAHIGVPTNPNNNPEVVMTKSLLAQKYPEGTTVLQETSEGSCKVLTIIVVHGTEGHRYTQKAYSYATYWFKDDENITKAIFDLETAGH
ncbi:MAG TPA: hypothetical protein VNZ86_14455, partial [Bacteroidia bacterium]|nr:hypothetical protein [Bacteroidia bacterium]